MAVLAWERRQPSTVVRCGGCGDTFELSTRNAQRWHSEGREPRCPMCRKPRKPLTDLERTRYARFWRERFSDQELVELADAIWGPSC